MHVSEEIDAFSKLKFEADFQKLSPGGAISYVEVPNMQNNIPAVVSVMRFIYDNIMYAELNTKSDFCESCGYNGEILVKEDETGKLVWECPNCGNRDQNHEKDLRVYRNTVLESRQDSGNKGQSTAFVEFVPPLFSGERGDG